MLSLDIYTTLVAASLVLLVGRLMVSSIKPLYTYSIPEPVVGGLVAAIVLLVTQQSFGLEIRFDESMKTPLMLCFFASIGLNAELASLKRGGKPLILLIIAVVAFLFVQNFAGVVLAKLFGLDPLIGLIAGSITLSGGHGTGAAWGSVFSDRYGLSSATELAMACATYGLVSGGIIGGPVAKYLHRKIKRTPGDEVVITDSSFEDPDGTREISAPEMIETVALFALCMFAGSKIADRLHGSVLELPTFVWVLFIGVVLRNTLAALGWYRVFDRCVSVLGNVALAVFLAMALMTMRLGQLTSVAMPLFIILALQTVVMAAWAIFVTFRAMGSNYDAMVIAAGHCGFGLGATPTAIANMQAITDNHSRPSHLAFLLVPMVGAFFVDLANVISIKSFLAFLY